ncbi:MAG TPA: TonB-dependent receptor [Kofleriaceae bacterium]
MARRVALIALCAARVASADNPRDVFDIPAKASEPPLDCSDGRAFGCVQATDPLDGASPFALSTWLPASYLLSLPVGDATHDQVASYALGAGRDEAGPTFGGATGLENRWTIEGAPSDSVKTGASETAVPLAFLDGLLVTAGGFSARDRASTGGTIDAQLRRGTKDHQLEAYAWLTYNAPSREPEIAPDTYQVRRGYVSPAPRASAAVVATGPLGELLGGHAWYAAGIAPSVQATDFTWHAASLLDADQDGLPDGYPGTIDLHAIEDTAKTPVTWSVPVMARAGWDAGVHHVDLTLVGSGATQATYLFNSTLQAAGIDQTSLIGDAIATWRGEWTDTHARVQLAWHRAMRWQSAADPAAEHIPQLLSAYVPNPLPEDPALGGACSDGAGDPFPKLQNCPVPIGYFASGGAGLLADSVADRPSVTADLAHRIENHVLRAGVTEEDSRLVTTAHFTGGEQDRSLFPGETSARQFIAPNLVCPLDPAQACPTVSQSVLTWRTSYAAAYAEDTWRAAPNLRVDGGVRWELMWVGPDLHFSHELAPRFGASWDPLGNGRSRVWTSAGRQFGMLPAGLGQTVIGSNRTVDNIASQFAPGRIVDTGAPFTVVSGIEPLTQDELTAGADLNLARAARVRVWLQGRWLRDGLETTPDGFDNPGHDGGEPATRATGLVAAELETAPTAKLKLRVGYEYAKTIGSWTGPYDPRQGAILYAGTDFDLGGYNQTGALPSQMGSRVYVEAERRGKLGPVGVVAALRLTLAAGRPRDALGDTEDGEFIDLIPRGSAGESPMISQANVRLGASWRGFDVTLDLVNLFDRTDESNINTVYAAGQLQPIIGGSYADLVFLTDLFGQPAVRETTYAMATAFQTPFSAVLGVHHAL